MYYNIIQTATPTGCGKLLRALSTTLNWKLLRGTQLIAVPNGNKDRDWTIRSGIPNLAMIRVWYLFRERKVVGLSDLINRNEGLRYVPASSES